MSEGSVPSSRKEALFSCPDKLFQAFLNRYRYSILGALVKGVVHNLNGTLQVLSLHMELLQRAAIQEGPASFPLIQEKIAQCLGQVEKLRSMVDGLMQRGMREEEEGPSLIQLNHLLEEELRLLHHNLFFKHQIQTRKSFASPLPPIKGHYCDFSIGLGNLIHNAVEAMEETSMKELEIRTLAQANQVAVTIKDTGCGIAETVRPRLFQPFNTNKGSGHDGLGLFLAAELLTPYGASFSYQSRPGETVFTVCFPLAGSP